MDKRAPRIFGLLVLLLFAVPVFGQGVRYDNFVLKPLAVGGVTPVSGALITVCTSAGTGTPCTPKVANIYSDEALTTPITGSGGAGTTNSDANGNYGFYITPGSYVVTITGTGISSSTVKITLPMSLSANNAFTGNNTHSGTETFKNINNVRFADQFAGANAGAQINAACLDLPAAGGIIDARGLTGTQTSSTDWAASCTAAKVTVLLGQVTMTMNQVGATYSVQPKSNWHIIGAGPGVSVLKHNSNVASVRMFDTPEGITNFSIEGVELDGQWPTINEASAQNHCVMLRDAYRFLIRNSYIHNCNGSGVLVWGGGAAGTAFTGEVVGTGNGTLTVFDYTVLNPQIKPGSITVTAGAVTGTDAAQFPGVITGTGNPLNLKGSYEPGTGEIRLIFATAVPNATSITINYTGGAGAQQASTSGEITGNWTKNNVTAGFGLIASRDVNVHDNYDYTTISFSGIDVEPANVGQYAMDLNIHDNQMRGAAGINLTCQVQGTATLCRNNHVHHNEVTAGGTINARRHIDTEVSGNFITNSLDPQGPLQLVGRGYTVTGNVIGPSSVLLTSTACAAGISLDATSTNDTSGLPAGTGNSIISNNHVDRAYVNGICIFNASNNLISGNVVTNTLVNQGTANGVRLANTVANLTDRNLLVGNQSGDNQTVATQVNGYLFDAGVTNTKFLSNTGTGNTTNLLLDNGTGTFRLDDTNAVTLAGAQTLTNKTCGSGNTSFVCVVASVNLTAQQANISATTLLTPSANGFYRGSCFTVVTQAATTSSTLPFCQVTFTDADASFAQTSILTNSNTGNSVGTVGATILSTPPTFFAKSGVAIQYQTISYASVGATPMQYAIHVRLEGPF